MSSKAKYMVKHINRSPLSGKKLTFAQRGALEQLADDHNEDRGRAHISVKDIAGRMGITSANARIHLQNLESAGVIESRARVSDDGRIRLANEYRFWFDPPFDQATTTKTEKLMEYQAMMKAAAPLQMSFTPLSESIEVGLSKPIEGVLSESIEGTPETDSTPLSVSIEGSLLNKTYLRERETARARESGAENATKPAPDLKPLALQIALAHPYALARRWGAIDVPVAHLVAVVEAIRAEVAAELEARKAADPSIDFDRGGTPETDRGALSVEQGLRMLAKVERIAREVPRSEWRFLKSLDKFMRLREYRMEPNELYHAEPNRGGSDAQTEHHSPTQRPVKKPSASAERGVTSRNNVDSAVDRLRRRRAGGLDEVDPS